MELELTEEEIIKTEKSFLASKDPLKLKTYPAKEKQKQYILKLISGKFEKGKIYKEIEVNMILKPIYPDFATIRRDLIDGQYLKRSADGREYELI
jgi:hypothetical protein